MDLASSLPELAANQAVESVEPQASWQNEEDGDDGRGDGDDAG